MSSRLCAGCKSVHKRPWDEKCKTFLEQQLEQNPGEFTAQTANMATSPQSTVKDQQVDPTLKLCNELLSQMKGMSSQMDRYEKRFDELSAKITVKSPPSKVGAKNVDNVEPVFASSTNTQAQRPEASALEKTPGHKGARPKTGNHRPPSVHPSRQKPPSCHTPVRNRGFVAPERVATVQ